MRHSATRGLIGGVGHALLTGALLAAGCAGEAGSVPAPDATADGTAAEPDAAPETDAPADVVPDSSPAMPDTPAPPDVGLDAALDAGPDVPPEPFADAPPAPAGLELGRAPLRRLSHFEYDNVLRDLLGFEEPWSLLLPPSASEGGFDNNADVQVVTQAHAEAWLEVSELVGEAVAQAAWGILPCPPDGDIDPACVQTFVADFGGRAFRRPLSPAQQARYEALFQSWLDEADVKTALRLTVSAMLQSPFFLYRVELGLPHTATDGVVRLTPWEVAARLSFLLWGALPDDELRATAASGALLELDEVSAQAARMLDDPRAADMVAWFHLQWLALDALPAVADLGEEQQEMLDELFLFLHHVLFEAEGTLVELLTAPYTVVPGSIDSAPAPVATDPDQRAGLLTQPGLLAHHSAGIHEEKKIILRGRFVRERLFCDSIGSPPPGVPDLPEGEIEGESPADKLAAHTSDPDCVGCHELMDPIGFAFEHFDGFGVWRDTYPSGDPIDAVGELIATDVDGPVDGAIAMGAALASSGQVKACAARHWYRYGTGRYVSEGDGPTFDTLVQSFVDSDGHVLELLETWVTTDGFRYLPEVVPAPLEEDAP